MAVEQICRSHNFVLTLTEADGSPSTFTPGGTAPPLVIVFGATSHDNSITFEAALRAVYADAPMRRVKQGAIEAC